MCTIFTAVGGTASPHRASTSASTDTVRFASSSSRDSRARFFCPRAGTASPPWTTSSGPNRRYSVGTLVTARRSQPGGFAPRVQPGIRGAAARTGTGRALERPATGALPLPLAPVLLVAGGGAAVAAHELLDAHDRVAQRLRVVDLLARERAELADERVQRPARVRVARALVIGEQALDLHDQRVADPARERAERVDELAGEVGRRRRRRRRGVARVAAAVPVAVGLAGVRRGRAVVAVVADAVAVAVGPLGRVVRERVLAVDVAVAGGEVRRDVERSLAPAGDAAVGAADAAGVAHAGDDRAQGHGRRLLRRADVGAPAGGLAVGGTQRAGELRPGRDGVVGAGGRPEHPLGAPAGDRAVAGPDAAGVRRAGRDRGELAGGRRAHAVVVVAPAGDGAVAADRARVALADGGRAERARRHVGQAGPRIAAPAVERVVGADAAELLAAAGDRLERARRGRQAPEALAPAVHAAVGFADRAGLPTRGRDAGEAAHRDVARRRAPARDRG